MLAWLSVLHAQLFEVFSGMAGSWYCFNTRLSGITAGMRSLALVQSAAPLNRRAATIKATQLKTRVVGKDVHLDPGCYHAPSNRTRCCLRQRSMNCRIEKTVLSLLL